VALIDPCRNFRFAFTETTAYHDIPDAGRRVFLDDDNISVYRAAGRKNPPLGKGDQG
jgi:hypothetical protein